MPSGVPKAPASSLRIGHARRGNPSRRRKFARIARRTSPGIAPPHLGGILYKPTLFDRHGPDAQHLLQAAGYMVLIFALTVVLFAVLAAKLQLHGFRAAAFVAMGATGSAAALGWLGYRAGSAVGDTWKRFAVDGTSTPYKEQYSYQQALVMQGRLDDALESFEAVIAEQPASVDARLRAAELYARDKGNHVRAAELFREVQRIESVSTGEFVLATNRLVDLFNGPLGEPGRAMVELRRLIERYPSTPAAAHARDVLARMKSTSSRGSQTPS